MPSMLIGNNHPPVKMQPSRWDWLNESNSALEIPCCGARFGIPEAIWEPSFKLLEHILCEDFQGMCFWYVAVALSFRFLDVLGRGHMFSDWKDTNYQLARRPCSLPYG